MRARSIGAILVTRFILSSYSTISVQIQSSYYSLCIINHFIYNLTTFSQHFMYSFNVLNSIVTSIISNETLFNCFTSRLLSYAFLSSLFFNLLTSVNIFFQFIFLIWRCSVVPQPRSLQANSIPDWEIHSSLVSQLWSNFRCGFRLRSSCNKVE